MNVVLIGLTILIVLVLLLIILIAVADSRKNRHRHRRNIFWPYDYFNRHYPYHPDHHHLIGGCAGTRFGCCSNGITARANRRGSNCPVY